MKKLIFIFLFLCAISHGFAANRYWVGGTAGNWTDITSWSETSGGASGATVPTTGDDVFFESGAPTTVTLGAAITVNSLTFTSRNVTFSGAFGITTNSMTNNSSELIFPNAAVLVNTALTFSGTSYINSTGSAGSKAFTLGNGGEFTLNGNSATSHFKNQYFKFNTTSPLTVFFSGVIQGIQVDKGLITLGSSTNVARLLLSATNNQELIIGVGTTLTLSGVGSSTLGLGSVANVGVVNASAAGSKFLIASTNVDVLDGITTGTTRIFKENSTINNLEFNSTTKIFVLGYPIRVRTLTLTAGTIDNTSNSVTLAPGGSVVTGAGTLSPNAVIPGSALTRYWVGGAAGNWSLATNWGVSSGSTSSPGIPELGDNVVFDAAVNASPTVTLTGAVTAEDISFESSNVTFAGAFGINTNSMTANSSQVTFVDAVTVNSSLTFAGASPRITQTSTTPSKAFTLGNGDVFTLTGNSSSNYFAGNGTQNPYYAFNTTSSLTVYFSTALLGSIIVTNGLITLGSNTNTQRMNLSAANSQELILGANTTLTLSSSGSSTLGSIANVGVVNASATGSKFLITSTNTGILSAGTNKIFKDATTINSLEFNSDTKTFILGYPITVKDLTLTAGTIDNTTNNITVAAGGKLTISTGTLFANNGITLESDATGIATLVDNYSTPTVTATVQQYLPQGRNWYVGSPIESTISPATTSNLIDAGLATSVSYYDETANGTLNEWVNNYTGNLIRGVGYVAVSAAGSGTNNISLTGIQNSGDVPVTLTRTGTGGYAGFNLIANPYPSYVNPMTALNALDVEKTIWYRTKGSTYKFETVNTTTGVGTDNSETGTAVTGYIPPLQAFWVRANTTNQVLTFTNAMRTHANPTGFTTTAMKARQLQANSILRLKINGTTGSDEAVLYFNAAASNDFDNYDSHKMFEKASANMPEIYTLASNEKLVINGLNTGAYDTEIPLGFAAKQAADYSISVNEMSNFETGTHIFLIDKQTNTSSETELTIGAAYTFNASVTAGTTDRFSLIFRTTGVATGIDNETKLNAHVFVNAANQITIIAPEKSNYAIYNAMGQLTENGILKTKYETLNAKFAAGVYFVELLVNGQRKIQKVIIR